jgi:TP901 family phage tail tape measure protein
VQRKVALESEATNISNAAYKEGGTRIDPAALQKIARDQGTKYAMDPASVIGGLGAYQEKTGDLPTAMAGLEGLTRLAKATNTQLNDMISAAGDVGNALGDVGVAFKTPEEKAAAVERVMRGIAAQGQEGAVEIKSLATQMAKLAAASGFFEGSSEKNLEKMGALVQLARQGGGASSSTAAATSISAFVNTLRTPARRAQFKAAGVEIEGKGGMLKDPFEIIKDSIKATGGDTDKMKKLFASVIGDKPVTALTTAYKKAGGGEAGMAEVDRQLNRFSGTMSSGQIQSNIEESMGTTASKAQQFQNRLDQMGSNIADKVLPALERVAPTIENLVGAFAGVVGWAAENPGSAIVTAITASIAKAAIGSAINTVLESALKKVGESGLGGQLAIASAVITAEMVVLDKIGHEQAKGAGEYGKERGEADLLIGKYRTEMALHGEASPETLESMQKLLPKLEDQKKEGENVSPLTLAKALLPGSDTTVADYGHAKAASNDLEGLRADIKEMTAAIKANKPPKNVTVDNMPGGGGPVAGAGTSNTGAPAVGGRR